MLTSPDAGTVVPDRSAHQVLVVDDDAGIRSLLSYVLTEEGHSVTEARNGAEALATLRGAQARHCLALIDLMMPVMNGWELASHLRDDPDLPRIPFVLVSAYPLESWGARELGAASSLGKPVDLDRLLATVHEHCAAA